MSKLNFYTVKVIGGYVGKCKQLPSLEYGPKKNRDTALSGVKRAAKKVAIPLQQTAPAKPTVVDCSGSMSSLESATAKALNSSIETIKQQAKATGQDTLLEVVLFSSGYNADIIKVIRSLGNVQACAPISAYEVNAHGGTPLWEATKRSIETLQAFPTKADEDVGYVVMVITDGGNTDRHDLAPTLSQLIKSVQSTDKWTVTFLTPPGYKSALVSTLNLFEGNVQEWEGTVKGVETYTASNNAGFSNYFSSRAMGASSVKSFYTTDLSNISTKDVKKALNDLSGQFRVLTVKAEAEIKPFVESETGKPYTAGSAFYQLTKDEKVVQSYKELLIVEKGKKAIYGGPDARTLLGLPVGQDVKVRPGNHANFDLFVQSTSNNRKLVRGTKLLVKS